MSQLAEAREAVRKIDADVDEDVRLMDELSKAAAQPREAGSAQKFNAAFADVINRLADYRARIDALEGASDY